jgi:hypothetical protein
VKSSVRSKKMKKHIENLRNLQTEALESLERLGSSRELPGDRDVVKLAIQALVG